ncbi:Pyrimidine 5-nucleotidase, eukaryotic [Sesbania bispinosa]|nr:Pyrimidine 5-nucleotidase, eukaryotic [Sesbania bispinosa]
MAAPVHEKLGDIDDPIDDNALFKERTNVLLLGDHIGDLGMSDGLNYETRISVGFLNHNIENSLKCYREAFDVVLVAEVVLPKCHVRTLTHHTHASPKFTIVWNRIGKAK